MAALTCPLRTSRHHHPQVVCSLGNSCWAPQASSYTARPRSRPTCCAAADGTAGKLPVVDDAISLPPPATGSQYAWRRSWGGASQAGSGGGGGSGRSGQARTAEWGRGPNSSMLFVILYRMRLLLLYGVWVTVLYGAFRAVVDLTTAAGKAGYHMINRAANMLYGPEDGFEGDGSSSGSPGESTPDAAASQRVAAAAAECSEEAAADGSNHTGAGAGSRASSSSFPAKNRPTATVFEDMMSAVIPVYLMLLGSVVFFASI